MRKDNELLILANKGVSKPKFWNPILDTCFKRKSQETPKNSLTGDFREYLTEIDCTSPCERLPDEFNVESFQDGYSEGVAAGMTIIERSKKDES